MVPQPQYRGVSKGQSGPHSRCPRTVGPGGAWWVFGRKMALWEEPGMGAEAAPAGDRERRGWRRRSGRAPPATAPGSARLGSARAPPHVARLLPRRPSGRAPPAPFPRGSWGKSCLRTRAGAFVNEARPLRFLQPGTGESAGSPRAGRLPACRPQSAVLGPSHPPKPQNRGPDHKGQPGDPNSNPHLALSAFAKSPCLACGSYLRREAGLAPREC